MSYMRASLRTTMARALNLRHHKKLVDTKTHYFITLREIVWIDNSWNFSMSGKIMPGMVGVSP